MLKMNCFKRRPQKGQWTLLDLYFFKLARSIGKGSPRNGLSSFCCSVVGPSVPIQNTSSTGSTSAAETRIETVTSLGSQFFLLPHSSVLDPGWDLRHVWVQLVEVTGYPHELKANTLWLLTFFPCKKRDSGKEIKTEVTDFLFKVSLHKEAQRTAAHPA